MPISQRDYQNRLRVVVEWEFGRFREERSLDHNQKAIDSFAIEKTRADTQKFLNTLNENQIIQILGGRVRDSL